MSRRAFLGLAAATGAAAVTGAAAMHRDAGSVIERALRSDPNGVGSLGDIDHIVLLMQENRSFDHYFGTMSGVRGFDDMTGSQAAQRYGGRVRLPFHLDTAQYPSLDPDILNDPSHSWQTQHAVWNQGAMDAWMSAHVATDGPLLADEVMGYFERSDIPTHYELADAFTVCDHYFSSVLGPTAPNRMYWMTGTIDPDGLGGGPITDDAKSVPHGTLNWRTYPENLQDAGVSWKVYNSGARRQHTEFSGCSSTSGRSEIHRRSCIVVALRRAFPPTFATTSAPVHSRRCRGSSRR